MSFREIKCSSAVHAVKGPFPYLWDLNPYRGCAHRCQYCFAHYSHKYLESDAFYDEIYVKTNIAEQLERQLSKKGWTQEVINLGGVTDCYQPAEARYKLMPDILRLLIRYRTPCIISTKSELILRDLELLEELSRLTLVCVASTITTTDEDIRRRLEPGAAPSAKRFKMLKGFAKTGVVTGVHIMPIVPYLTDQRSALDELFSQAKDADAEYAIPALLNLRGRTRQVFFDFLKRDYPTLYPRMYKLYSEPQALKELRKHLFPMVWELLKKHSITGDYNTLMKERLPYIPEQLSLF